MKQNFRLLDVIAQTAYLKKLENWYLQNVYSLGSQTIILKFNRPGEGKQLLLIETGRRIHITNYARTLPNAPSQEVRKIRMHLCSKRLSSVKQVEGDRIVELKFEKGRGIDACYLQVQLFTSGAIIMYDHTHSVLLSFKASHKLGSLTDVSEKTQKIVLGKGTNDLQRFIMETSVSTMERKDARCEKRLMYDTLKNVIGNELTDLLFHKSGIDYKDRKKKTEDIPLDELESRYLNEHNLEQLKNASDFIEGIFNDAYKGNIKGWVIGKGITDEISPENVERSLVGFYPYDAEWNLTNPELSVRRFETFNEAIDYYFYHLEYSKLARDSNAIVRKKVGAPDAARVAQEQNIKTLEVVSLDAITAAKVLESNLHIVDKLLNELRTCLEDGWDWVALGEFIKECAEEGIPQAKIVYKINYANNKVTIKLAKPDCENKLENIELHTVKEEPNLATKKSCDSELHSDSKPPIQIKSKGAKMKLIRDRKAREEDENILIDLDINISALANLAKIYGQKRTADTKKIKTEDAIKKIVRKVKAKPSSKNNPVTSKQNTITKIRTPYWFESLIWSISPENYLVVAGADASKKDIILRRYMSPNDIIVSADIEGSLLVLIKNNEPNDFIGLDTLNHAGAVSICYSKAWLRKIVMSPWWIYPNQVITEDSRGVPFDKGVFFVDGEKHWLNYVHLNYGVGILFRVESESQSKHYNERTSSQKKPYVFEGINDKCLNKDYSFTPNQKINLNTNDIIAEKNPTKPVTSSKQPFISNNFTNKSEALVIPESDMQGHKNKESISNKKSKNNSIEVNEKCHYDYSKVNKIKTEPKKSLNTKVRGKYGKLKKIKFKYLDHDEEDIILHEFLSNPKGTAQKNLNLCLLNRDNNDTNTNHIETQNIDNLNQYNISKDQDTKEPLIMESKLRNKRHPFIYDPTILNELTALPNENDKITFAIPVCAPWNTIKAYKYKVKLLPGNMKRSQAVTSSINAILYQKNKRKPSTNINPNNLLSGIPDTETNQMLLISEKELLLQIPANVKLETLKPS